MRPLSALRSIYRNQLRRTDLPRFLTYIVTFTCNARCIMCDSWKKPSRDVLKVDELERIFDQLPKMDIVRLSGGEPFVRPDLLDIAELVQRKLEPLCLHVTTNGFLTDAIVDFCERRDRRIPLMMLVSLDGVGDKHNEVRGRSNAWQATIDTLHALALRQRELRVRLLVNQTIVDADGAEQYRKLREFLEPLGVRNQVVFAYDASATYGLAQDVVVNSQIGRFTAFGELTPADLTRFLEQLEADLEDVPWLERIAKRYYIAGIRSRLLGAPDGAAQPSPKCVALSSHMRLMPNGDVPVCQFNNRRVGNLRHESFDQVWFGKGAERHRSWVHACAGCWAECEVLPSAVYTGDIARFATREAAARVANILRR